MPKIQFTEEFRQEAIRQIVDRGRSVAEVSAAEEEVNRSGYYAWQANPESKRQKQDTKLLGLIKQSWLENGSVYGYRKVTDDLPDIGTKCGKHRVYKLMKQAKLASQCGYNCRPYMRSGLVAQAAPNRLEQNFTVPQSNKA